MASFADGELHAGELGEALAGVAGDPGAVLRFEAVFEEPVGEGFPIAEGDLAAHDGAGFLVVEGEEFVACFAVDALVHGFVDSLVEPPNAGADFFVDLFFDGELEGFFDEDAVEVVEVGAVFGGADAAGEFGVVDFEFFGPAVVPEEGLSLGGGYEVGGGIEEALGEEEPIEGFVGDEVAIVATIDDFFGKAPAADGIQECMEPVLAGTDGLSHANDDFVGRGQAIGFVFGAIDDGRWARVERHSEVDGSTGGRLARV